MRKSLRVLLYALLLPACSVPEAHDIVRQTFSGEAGQWVDLSYSFQVDTTIYWPTAEPFQLEQVAYGATPAGYFYAANNFCTAEHGGTHVDAPIHFAEHRPTTDEIPVQRLIGPAVVVDVSLKVDADYLITEDDLSRWEAAHGPMPAGAIVMLRTGWGERWPNRSEYLGTSRTGTEAIPELHFPGLAPGAARWLAESRNVDAVGIDTPSIDRGQSTLFESHQILFEAEIPVLENVANLDLLPEEGSFVVALPMKISGGSGGPTRIVAFLPTGS